MSWQRAPYHSSSTISIFLAHMRSHTHAKFQPAMIQKHSTCTTNTTNTTTTISALPLSSFLIGGVGEHQRMARPAAGTSQYEPCAAPSGQDANTAGKGEATGQIRSKPASRTPCHSIKSLRTLSALPNHTDAQQRAKAAAKPNGTASTRGVAVPSESNPSGGVGDRGASLDAFQEAVVRSTARGV